jgi:hypothetical protein
MTQPQPFSSMGSFFVKSLGGDYYPASFLTYADGTPIVDAVLANGISPWTSQQLTLYADKAGTILPNPNNYLVGPSADFANNMFRAGQIYGGLLQSPDGYEAAQNLLTTTFAPKLGYGDPQYQGFGTGIADWARYASNQLLGTNFDNTQNWIPARPFTLARCRYIFFVPNPFG